MKPLQEVLDENAIIFVVVLAWALGIILGFIWGINFK